MKRRGTGSGCERDPQHAGESGTAGQVGAQTAQTDRQPGGGLRLESPLPALLPYLARLCGIEKADRLSRLPEPAQTIQPARRPHLRSQRHQFLGFWLGHSTGGARRMISRSRRSPPR